MDSHYFSRKEVFFKIIHNLKVSCPIIKKTKEAR
jgi:hypothetical protein